MPEPQDDMYAAPDAELGGEGGSDAAGDHFGVPTSFGDTLSEIMDLFSEAFTKLLVAALIWGALNGATNFVTDSATQNIGLGEMPGPEAFVPLVGLIIFGPFIWIYGVQRVHNIYERNPGEDEFDVAVSKFLPMLAFYILLMLMSGVGFALCIIPGVIVGTMLSVGDISIIVEDRGPIDAVKRAFGLFESIEDWFYVFGIFFAVGVLVGIPSGILGAIVGVASQGSTVAINAVNAVVTAVTFPLWVVVHYLAFRGLVARHAVPEPVEPGPSMDRPGADGGVEPADPPAREEPAGRDEGPSW